jgi:hypothetical protein
VLHAIALMPIDLSGSALGEEGQSVLAELTRISGGQTLAFEYPSQSKSITEAFERIGTDVRSQYELVVESPQATVPRKWRKLKVTAHYTDASGKRKELKIRTREGLFR